MSLGSIIHWVVFAAAWSSALVYILTLQRRIEKNEVRLCVLSEAYNSAIELILAERKRKEEQAKVLRRLTDPESILIEMEKGARIREMRDANRTTLPREDAGPPAKVYTPTLRANVPKRPYKEKQD